MKQWRDTRRLGKWIAVSLLVGLAISLLWGVWALQRQQALAQAVEICCGFVSFYLALPLLELVLSLLQTMIGG